MTLDSYLTISRKTETDIAKLAGCSQSAVNKVRNGAGNPTFDLLRRISEATAGAFQPNDFRPGVRRVKSAPSKDRGAA